MKKYDLIVAGGGMAGVSAAITAGRQGLKVLLVERFGCLGGAMTNSLVYPFMRHWTLDPTDGSKTLLTCGLLDEMKSRHYALTNEEPSEKPDVFKTEQFKIALDDMTAEAGVDVLYHSMIYEVTYEQRKIKSIKAATKAGTLELFADFFIDATGDGEVIYLAGCDYLLGRDSDNLTQPMTTCFRVCNIDMDKYHEELPRLQELYKEYQRDGKITNPRENILQFYGLGDGIVHYNTTRVTKLDPTNPMELSRAEAIARRQVLEMFNFLKQNSEAYKNATLVSVASEIGVRESRKLRGVHILTEEELYSCTMFEDRIALGNYDVDIHSPDGTGTRIRYFDKSKYYSVPYRSLVPKEYDNLLVAGRCISSTHEGHSAVRIMPICVSMGEAAGVATALAKKNGTSVQDINVSEMQTILRKNGVRLD